ncbi:carboxypeptidase regulatory-like domain-containing protein [Haloferula sp. A504]|uniref:TonB-dependent receptor n=1 Tax=Haloferula sp. A504 TaxID=3373601 RepID=UPI0031C7E67C|nr:outer membrane beta-barrel protein [Verrucomicrobiaceae bacterium E54]
MALESLPVSAGVTASAALLPTKDAMEEPPSCPVIPLDRGELWSAPWQQGLEVIPAFFELPDPLGRIGAGPSPFLKVLAGEDEGDVAGGATAGDELVPDDEVEEAPAEDAVPEGEVGIGPPERSDEPWVPAEPADPGLDPVDPGAGGGAGGGGEPRDLLPIEREQGNCVITGEVSDVTTLEPIAGASVVVIGQGREDITDAQGRFEIGGLPPGDYTVEALKLEYSMGEAAASPRPGSPAEVRIALRKKPAVDTAEGEFLLAEESIVGEYSEGNQGDFTLDLEIETPSLRSGMSEEDFAKAAVSDAGEALEKVSGANVVDGAFAVVRGLADRYVTTTLNGGQISSAVPDRKAVRLDLFPTSAMRAIVVDKTYREQLLGDFGGAAIDLQTKVFPEDRVISFKVKREFNPSLPDYILTSQGSDMQYFQGIPNSNKIDRDAITGTNGFLIPGSPERNPGDPPTVPDAQQAWVGLFNTRYLRPVARKSRDEESFSAAIGDTIELTDSLDLGFLVAGGAKSEDSFNATPLLRVNGETWDQEDYQRQYEWNLYAAAGLKLNDQHELTATYFRKNITQDNVQTARNIEDGEIFGTPEYFNATTNLFGASASLRRNFDQIDIVEQDLEVFQLAGKHKLGDRGPSVNWGYTTSDALEDRPNYSLFQWTTLDFTDEEAFQVARDVEDQRLYNQILRSFPDAPDFQSLDEAGQYLLDQGVSQSTVDRVINQTIGRYPVVDPSLGTVDTLALLAITQEAGPGNFSPRTVQEIKENTVDQRIDLDLPYYFSEEDESRGVRLNLGFSDMEKERTSQVSIYDLIPEFQDAAGNNIYGLPEDVLLALGEDFVENPELLQNFIDGYWQGSVYFNDNTLGNNLSPPAQLINNVEGKHTISSHYIGGEWFFDDWFLKGGIRYEQEVRSATILDPAPILPPDFQNLQPQEYEEILPAVTGGASFFDGSLIVIAGWSETAARPTFYEWLPTKSIDLSTGIIRQGNPFLANSEVTNYDLSFQYLFNESISTRVSFFHKVIEDPVIEQRLFADLITYSNGETSNLSGVEFEVSVQDLGPFSIEANMTYIDAELLYEVENPSTGMFETTSVSFPYQPEWLANINLGYEHEEWGLSANLIYNFTGAYNTILRTTEADPNLEQQAIQSLDLVLRKVWGDETSGVAFELGAGVKNLFATDRELVWRGGATTLDGRTHRTFEAQRTYFLEMKCLF